MWTIKQMENWANEHCSEKYIESVGEKPLVFDYIYNIESPPLFSGNGWLKIIIRKNKTQIYSYSYQHVPNPMKNRSLYLMRNTWEEIAQPLLNVCSLFDTNLRAFIERARLVQKNLEVLTPNLEIVTL